MNRLVVHPQAERFIRALAPEPYPVFHVTAITHRKDAVYPPTIVGIPPMEDFYIGGASVKLFLPIFKMNFPEIVDLALPAAGVVHNLVWSGVAHATRVSVSATRRNHLCDLNEVSGESPETAGGSPAATQHGLWGMGQMMFTKYLVVVDDDLDVHNTSEVLFRLCANTDPSAIQCSQKGQRMLWTMRLLKSQSEQSWELTLCASSPVKDSKGRGRR